MLIAASSGDDLVSRKSRLAQQLNKLSTVRHITIIDDNALDARHVTAVLHLLLGRAITVVHHKSVALAIASMRTRMPDLLFLDDVLPPLDRAETSLRSLHRQGLVSPIVIVTAMLTQTRRKQLLTLYPLGILHKDDIDSFSVGEILTRLVPDDAV
jgi:DNA-binding NarL/FixJ family response regulator